MPFAGHPRMAWSNGGTFGLVSLLIQRLSSNTIGLHLSAQRPGKAWETKPDVSNEIPQKGVSL